MKLTAYLVGKIQKDFISITLEIPKLVPVHVRRVIIKNLKLVINLKFLNLRLNILVNSVICIVHPVLNRFTSMNLNVFNHVQITQ